MEKSSCTVCLGTALLMVSLIAGCRMGTTPVIPNGLVRQAEPAVTLTALVTDPGRYRGKIVILGGVVLAEKREAGQLWLLLRNRPLDADYVPHRPISLVGPENGDYWVLIEAAQAPASSHQWARVTVVGRVLESPPIPPTSEGNGGPVLAALDVRDWPITRDHTETWQEHRNPQYLDARNGAEPFQGPCWTCGSLYGGE